MNDALKLRLENAATLLTLHKLHDEAYACIDAIVLLEQKPDEITLIADVIGLAIDWRHSPEYWAIDQYEAGFIDDIELIYQHAMAISTGDTDNESK